MPEISQNKRYAATGAVVKFTTGSFEHRSFEVAQALLEQRKTLFNEDGPAEVLATFPDSIVVLLGTSQFYRLSYHQEDGRTQFGKPVLLDVPVYEKSDMDAVLRQEAREILKQLGNPKADIQGRLKQLLWMTESSPVRTDGEWTDDLIRNLQSESTWKSLYRVQEQKIRKFLWSEIPALESAKLQPKFSSLYDGSTLEGSSVTVESVRLDLGKATQRIEQIGDLIGKAFADAKMAIEKIREAGDSGFFSSFDQFFVGLRESLASVRRVAFEAQYLGEAKHAGRVYDVLVEEIYVLELAGHFVVKMSQRLGEKAPQ